VVAEIQQSSNTTFRLFDWNRVGADGKSRPLHIAQGLAVTDYERGPVNPQPATSTEKPNTEQLVSCDKFVLNRTTVETTTTLGSDDGCHLLAVLQGSIEVGGVSVSTGETALLPAACGELNATAVEKATILDMYLP
jgi:mannose-6-phosphate isomerase